MPCAGGGVAAVGCFFAQPASVSPAHASAEIATDLAIDPREVIWSDRSARHAHGQEQNRVFMVWRGQEQFVEEMVLGSGGDEGPGPAPADPHFFLDFRLKPPYI